MVVSTDKKAITANNDLIFFMMIIMYLINSKLKTLLFWLIFI